MILRIKFKKYGAIRFIGHLDVMRFFQKAIRRAGIDAAYSGGYSPHQIMSFAAPLGVGLESNGEYMDIQVNSFTSCEDVRRRLNEASVRGIEIVSVKALPEKAGNAMASVAAASYTVRFREGREPDFMKMNDLSDIESPKELHSRIQGIVSAFMEQEHILFVKDTKKGSREVDLRPGIYEFSWNQNPMNTDSFKTGNNAFFMLVNASSAGNIKPSQVMEALLSGYGESLKENALLVTREETFADTGVDGIRYLVPLDDIGLDDSELSDMEFGGQTENTKENAKENTKEDAKENEENTGA